MENKVEILLSEQEVIDLLIKQNKLFVIHKDDVITPYDELVEDGEKPRFRKGDTIICKDKEYRVVKLNRTHIEESEEDWYDIESTTEFEKDDITIGGKFSLSMVNEDYTFVIK